MVLNLILAALTFMASGYSLSLMCLLRRLRRDPRPAAANGSKRTLDRCAESLLNLSRLLDDSEPTTGRRSCWRQICEEWDVAESHGITR